MSVSPLKKRASAPGPVVKVTVNLPEALYRQLRGIAERGGHTFTQALKEAIALKVYVEGVLAEGSKLLVERPDGSVREIVFLTILEDSSTRVEASKEERASK